MIQTLFEVYSDLRAKNDAPLLSKERYQAMIPTLHLIGKDDIETYSDWLNFQIKKLSFKKSRDRLDHVQYIADSMVRNVSDITHIHDVQARIDYLNSVPQPEQRTEEWYSYRHSVVTASSASAIFDSPAVYTSYVKNKVLPEKHFKAGQAAQHGIKFEPIAQEIYEDMTKTKITEYGCIKHKDIGHLGASPDGIVTEALNPKMLGRMLEIKCVYTRELTGIPLYGYWVQCQIQMEVCDLEYCDFLECQMDANLSPSMFYSRIVNNTNDYYGIIIEYSIPNCEATQYRYSDINLTAQELREWYDKTADELLADPLINFGKTTYWDLVKHSIVTLKRNREWFALVKPDIKSFWDDVENRRSQLNASPELKYSMFPASENNRRTGNTLELCMIDDE